MAFRIGQDIVCIDDEGFSLVQRAHAALPVKGSVYRVRSFTANGLVLLEGLCNEKFRDFALGYDIEPGFDPARFRPVVSRPNDAEAYVEQLKRDCIPSPTKVREREGVE